MAPLYGHTISMSDMKDLANRKERSNVLRCRACPKWHNGWCSILACVMCGNFPACDYGKRAAHSAYVGRKNKEKKRGAK